MPPLKQISRSAACSPGHRSPHKSPDKSPDKTPQGAEHHVDPGPASAAPAPGPDAQRPPTNGTLAKMEPEPGNDADRAGKAEGGEENGRAGSACGEERLVNGDEGGQQSAVDGGRAEVEGSPPRGAEEAGSGNGDQGPESDVENGHREEGVNTEPKVSTLLSAPRDGSLLQRGGQDSKSVADRTPVAKGQGMPVCSEVFLSCTS